MATPQANPKSSPFFSDWMLGLVVGLVTCVLGWLAWLYAGAGITSETRRPAPVWLGVSKVTSQLENGQMLAFKVGLRVKAPDDLKVLTPHVPALETLLQELGQGLSKDDLSAEDGLSDFAQDIRRSVNNYLRKQKVEPRVTTVAFEEIFLNP
jgi:flagellar basal body-associated protein FliL